MDNMLTVALVVLASSIVVFFSKEFGDLFKKIFAIPGMKLLLPLLAATALIVNYESWAYLVLSKIQEFLFALTDKLTSWMPFRRGASYMVNILVLMGLSFLPVIGINLWVKRKTYYSFQYANIMRTILWLGIAVLLTIDHRY